MYFLRLSKYSSHLYQQKYLTTIEMLKKLSIIIMILSIISSQSVNHKGNSISNNQLANILNIIANGSALYPNSLNQLALYIKTQMAVAYGQTWVVEIVDANGLVVGVSGAKYLGDQWVTVMTNTKTFHWISVLAPAASLIAELDPSVFLSYEINQNHGAGINSTQETAILSMMGRAELSKGCNPQVCAAQIEKDLEVAYGQDWIVQIYGSGSAIIFGRVGIQYTNDQWLFYQKIGTYGWQYFIWVPNY